MIHYGVMDTINVIKEYLWLSKDLMDTVDVIKEMHTMSHQGPMNGR